MILSDAGQPAEAEGAASRPGTIGAEGRRQWLYPREITGRFTRRRRLVAWLLLVVYLGAPWIKWNGEPLVRLDVYGRKLILFSHYYWAQDLSLFLPGVIASGLLAFIATARYGRLWCGWACPQTVFLQFLFAPIEKWIEGRASTRKARDAGPMTAGRFYRKTVKHAVFLLLAAWIGNTALAYFWGRDNLLWAVAHPSRESWAGMAFVLGFTAVFYWVFAFFKEQACVLICPYARLQSVLLDERTSLIAYDAKRGEARGKARGGKREGLGDCVDCFQCVQVCPTGIDIRHGQQLECIGCARCIDACDRTMSAWKKPAGLIRYASLGELQGKVENGRNWRVTVYGALALALAAWSAALLLFRPSLGMDLVRRGKAPYEHAGIDSVRNTFSLHIRNKDPRPRTLRIEPLGDFPARMNWAGREFSLSGGQLLTLPVDITAPKTRFRRGKLEVRLSLVGDGLRPVTQTAVLAGPWGR
jgi:cytochrome c oxidase accessory protein FixG